MAAKKSLNVILLIIALLLQGAVGLVVGFIFSVVMHRVWVISMISYWVGLTIGIFLMGGLAILLRRSISPKKYLARLGFTALGALIPIAILTGLGLSHSLGINSEETEDRWGFLLVCITLALGILGFYVPGWIRSKSKT